MSGSYCGNRDDSENYDRLGGMYRVADQQDKRSRRIGARVWLRLAGEERTTGILLSTANIGVVIREDAKAGVVVLPWNYEGEGWGFAEEADS